MRIPSPPPSGAPKAFGSEYYGEELLTKKTKLNRKSVAGQIYNAGAAIKLKYTK